MTSWTIANSDYSIYPEDGTGWITSDSNVFWTSLSPTKDSESVFVNLSNECLCCIARNGFFQIDYGFSTSKSSISNTSKTMTYSKNLVIEWYTASGSYIGNIGTAIFTAGYSYSTGYLQIPAKTSDFSAPGSGLRLKLTVPHFGATNAAYDNCFYVKLPTSINNVGTSSRSVPITTTTAPTPSTSDGITRYDTGTSTYVTTDYVGTATSHTFALKAGTIVCTLRDTVGLYVDGTLVNSGTNKTSFTRSGFTAGNTYTVKLGAWIQGLPLAVAYSNEIDITVGTPPTISISPMSYNAKVGIPVTYSSTYSQFGDGDISFLWDVTNGTEGVDYTISSTTTQNCSITYLVEGTFYVTCTITDSLFGSTTSDIANAVVTLAPSASFTVSDDTVETGVEVAFTNTSTVASGYTLTYLWAIPGTDGVDWTLGGEQALTDEDINVTFLTDRVYSISLTATIYGTTKTDVAYKTITVATYVPSNANPIRRYKIVLRDGDNVCIVTRNKTLSSMPRFTSLEFGSIVCESGEASFTLIGANRLETTLFDALIKQGTDVFILDDESVVWAGHIFNVAETNTQYYNNAINTPPSMHTVKCMDSIDKLSTMEYSGDVGLVSDTIENIITGTLTHEGILPEGYSGTIGYSDEADIELDTTQRTVFTYEITDRLTLLNQLSDSTGWRYRCRPNVIARHAAVTIDEIGYNYVNFTIDNGLSDYLVGDMFYLKLAQESTDISGFALFTAAEVTIGVDTTFIRSKVATTIVYKPVTPTALSVNYGLVWREYVYDFAPSFYQQSTVKDYTINKHAFDVSNASAISDKHGVVSAYSRSMTNEYITSNWKLFMTINKNYTIPSAYVITNSSDSYVTDIVRLSPAALGYVYLHLKGWTTPTTVADYQAMNPSFYVYTGGAYVRKTFPTNASNVGCIRTIERCINSNGDKYTKIGLNDYDGEFFDTYPVVIGTEIICDRYELYSGIGLTAGDYVMIGDEPQTVVSKVGDDTVVVYRTVNTSTSYPQVTNMHGHMTGTLVFKTTALGVTATDIQADSPMDKYGEVILSKKATDGYTRMELERVAQNFAQYGSNYTDQGTASIPLGYFEKPDVTFGTTVATPLIAGDHISLSSLTASTLDYELLGYENKTDKMMVSVTYGMPTWNIAYVVYGIYSNGSLTINPPDYE